MKKVIRDGKVAILVSHGFGAGWSTWYDSEQLLFDPKIVEMVEQGKAGEIDEDWIEENLGLEDIYCGGASGLEIHWLPIGTIFNIKEYDGAESLNTTFIIA